MARVAGKRHLDQPVYESRKGIEDGQLQKLQRLLSVLVPDNGFYSSKFRGRDLQIRSIEEFVRDFPFTTKGELADDQRQTLRTALL